MFPNGIREVKKMQIFDNYGRGNGKTMELACQIAEYIKGKGTVVVAPIKELTEEVTECEKKAIRDFAEWLAKCNKVSEPVREHTVNRWIEDFEKERRNG